MSKEKLALRIARWLLKRYAPNWHIHRNPISKEILVLTKVEMKKEGV
jgi:hypothetical protein